MIENQPRRLQRSQHLDITVSGLGLKNLAAAAVPQQLQRRAELHRPAHHIVAAELVQGPVPQFDLLVLQRVQACPAGPAPDRQDLAKDVHPPGGRQLLPERAQARDRHQVAPQAEPLESVEGDLAGQIAQFGHLQTLPAGLEQLAEQPVGQRRGGVWQIEEARAQQVDYPRHRGLGQGHGERGQGIAHHRDPLQGDPGGEVHRQAAVVLTQAVEFAPQQVLQGSAVRRHV